MTDAPVRAAIYCRISLAAIGDTTKTADQERICRELAARLGWEVAGVYSDNSQSAWKHDRKRPAWDAMLADIEAGKVSGIVVYHGDRLLRTQEDLLLLIKLARTRGIKLASPVGTRDLGNYDDQFILEIEASMAKRESANLSRRKKMEYARLNRRGLVRPGGGGGRALGFETDGVTHRQDEADAIRRAAAAILGGQSVRSVLAELAGRGLLTTAGNVPSQSSFTRSLLLPRMAGLMPDGVTPAAWPPVLERAQWEALTLKLSGRAGRTGNRAVHLLAGLIECGLCGHPMYSGYPGSARYRCPQDKGCGKVSRDRELLDAYVSRRTWRRLNDPESPEPRIPEAPGLAAEFAALSRALAETDDALADHTRGAVPALLARREGIEKRLADLRELAAGDAAARLRAAHQGISWEEFGALPLSTRRALVTACFRITVRPASKRGPGFNSRDVRLQPL